jgi:hypothetical protein
MCLVQQSLYHDSQIEASFLSNKLQIINSLSLPYKYPAMNIYRGPFFASEREPRSKTGLALLDSGILAFIGLQAA